MTNEEIVEEFKHKFQYWEDGLRLFAERVLEEKELKILDMRNNKHTLDEVGKEFGVTRERIRQIEAKAREKIRMKDYVTDWLKNILEAKDTEIQKAREEERERIENNLPEYWLDSESVPFDCDHNRCIELVKKALTPSSHGTKRNY